METKVETGELVIERVFNAPRELVWKAWTDPESMKQWWGPTGFTSPRVEIDFRVGGKFLGSMSNPDFAGGRVLYSTGTYKEIIPLERIVATDSFSDEHGNIVPASYYDMPGDIPLEMSLTVLFEDAPGGKTKLTIRHGGLPKAEADGASVGWNQSLDKLADLLAE